MEGAISSQKTIPHSIEGSPAKTDMKASLLAAFNLGERESCINLMLTKRLITNVGLRTKNI